MWRLKSQCWMDGIMLREIPVHSKTPANLGSHRRLSPPPVHRSSNLFSRGGPSQDLILPATRTIPGDETRYDAGKRDTERSHGFFPSRYKPTDRIPPYLSHSMERVQRPEAALPSISSTSLSATQSIRSISALEDKDGPTITAARKSEIIQNLARDLEETRKHIAAAAVKREIYFRTDRAFEGIILVSDLQALLEKAGKELSVERNKRVKAENVLKDVQRECKEPSVVPALRKALLELPSPSTPMEA